MRLKAIVSKASLLGFVAFAAMLLPACAKKPEKKQPPPMPVSTGDVKIMDVPVFISSFGCLTPVNNVDIKSQVTGKVMEARFVEGQKVKSGDVLFVIDKRPFQASLDNYVGVLGEDKADLAYARFMVDSNKNLAEKTIMSAQQFEKYKTNVDLYQSKIISDKAQIDTAQINLDYCDIKAPVDGVTGKRLVDPGNIVTGNDGSTLVNMKTLDPIYADFSVPEKYFSQIKAAMDKAPLSVELTPRGSSSASVGTLSLINNTVDTSTGTLALRATVKNPDGKLWPGQFITTKLILSVSKDALVVPGGAVQYGQKGAFVYAMREGKACQVLIEPRQGDSDDFVAVDRIVSGELKPGEKVVTAGTLLLYPGASIMDAKEAMAMAAKMMAEKQEPKASASDSPAKNHPESAQQKAK